METTDEAGSPEIDVIGKYIEHGLDQGAWVLATVDTDDGSALVRFRVPVVEQNMHGSYYRNLVVMWPYAAEGTGDLPSESDFDAMKIFEERIVPALETDNLAILAATLTFDGARQWLFYTDDVAKCGRAVSEMPQEQDPYPIELTTSDDPEWSYLHQILGPIDWESEQRKWIIELIRNDVP